MVGRSSMEDSGVSWLDSRVALLTAMAAAAMPRVSSNCRRVSTRVVPPSRTDTSSPPMANRTEICAPSPRRLMSSVFGTSATDQVWSL